MFWALYIFFTICFSYFISFYFNKNLWVFCFLLVLLITPAQIQTGESNYAPSLFTFIYNLSLEQVYSLRPLRPLLLSLPASFILIWTFLIIRKKFF